MTTPTRGTWAAATSPRRTARPTTRGWLAMTPPPPSLSSARPTGIPAQCRRASARSRPTARPTPTTAPTTSPTASSPTRALPRQADHHDETTEHAGLGCPDDRSRPCRDRLGSRSRAFPERGEQGTGGSCARGTILTWLEYRPSRRSTAPFSPVAAASYSATTSSLYCAVKLRRRGLLGHLRIRALPLAGHSSSIAGHQ